MKSPQVVGRLLTFLKGCVSGPSACLASGFLLVIFLICSVQTPLSAKENVKFSEDLIGVTVGKREVATMLVLGKDERVWLPLEELAKHISLTIESGKKSGPVSVKTPFGAVDIPAGRTVRVGGVLYIDQQYFEQRLNTRFDFDEEAYTLTIEPPWMGRRLSQAKSEELDKLVAEVVPPDYGLATVHGDISFETDINADSGNWNNSLRATGHAYGGVWQAHYYDDLYDDRRLSEAVWMKRLDDKRSVQVGHQTVALHPLLGSVEMTGVQGAWSSKPAIAMRGGFYPVALLTRRGRPQRTFSGSGPIGGFAELWINDRRIARREIGIDGTFEFVEVILPARLARVEMRVFDHRQPNAPVEIITETLQMSELLLDRGDYTAVAGGGASRNTFDRFSTRTHHDTEASGFTFGRYGLTDTITVEGSLLRDDGQVRALGGVVARLSPDVIASGAVAANDAGDVGYDVEVKWQKTAWRGTLHSYNDLPDSDADREKDTSGDAFHDMRHEGLLGYRYSNWLEFGAMGLFDRDDKYVLPYIAWRPTPNMNLRATPGSEGRYRIDANYHPTPIDSFFATANQDYANLTYTRKLNEDGLSLTAELDYGLDQHDWGAALGFTGRELSGLDISWRALASYSEEGWGFDASLRKQVVPGVIGFAEASSQIGRLTFLNRQDTRVRVGLSFDFAVTDDGLLPTTRRGVSADHGGLVGAILPASGSTSDLKDIPIYVDGRIAGRTKEGGYFHIPNIKRGKHIVEFDEEGLPIEQVALKRTIIAEVAPGAMTGMSFETESQFGASGRLTSTSGEPLTGVQLVVKSAGGETIGTAETNGFGYYRVDGLRPGSYTVSVAEGGNGASRSFTISNDYVFKIDLKS